MTFRTRFGGALAVAGASLTLTAAAAATTPPVNGGFLPAHAGETIPAHGGTATSLNWSGYAVTPTGGGVTQVNTDFTVPTANPLIPGFAATWAGIGGYSSQDLIQAGVTENSLVGGLLTGATYQAWYELLPASETPISGCTGDPSCTVQPGDNVSVHITQGASAGQWQISLTDAGHWSWSKTVSYASTESSAEWILEAPRVVTQTPLADVGTVHFGSGSSFGVNGASPVPIAAGNPTALDISPSPFALPGGIGDEATVSPLAADGASFNACAYALSCPAP
ncbi:G1 family glutamic endopeptidase [Conexibacter sp. DBS9H8]|uniref:G1 family glutamic endopeptidase n=1 Tax=Conexibacter sp. DBS9H8 TaxID=2937801 RepID=UPI00200FA94E|nr:G1 family glutamic endopeptidase [Conexibacter sp. DBS9H8]